MPWSRLGVIFEEAVVLDTLKEVYSLGNLLINNVAEALFGINQEDKSPTIDCPLI
jgi:hypothetical protein